MKKILVTGGAGFIGAHLCEGLLKDGFGVTCVDNFITGKEENIKGFFQNKNFKFLKHDAARPFNIKGKLDYVLHFASPASPQDYLKFPIQTLKAGSFGTYNALELALAKKAKFMLASTSEVYGDPLVHPQKELYWGNVNPVGPRSCYDEAKRFAEALTMAYRRVHKIDTNIARIFNTYGPKMRLNDGRVVPNFIYQALNNKPLTVYGKGVQTRSFCYVDDLIEGIFRLMRCAVNEPVNLGNPKEFSILELSKVVIKLAGISPKIIFKALPQDDPRQRRPDISRANKLLGWRPRIELEEGLNRTIGWFKKQR